MHARPARRGRPTAAAGLGGRDVGGRRGAAASVGRAASTAYAVHNRLGIATTASTIAAPSDSPPAPPTGAGLVADAGWLGKSNGRAHLRR